MASHVPADSSIHGPALNTPPLVNLASQTNKPPTSAVLVETCEVPIGNFVRSTGEWAQVLITEAAAVSFNVVVVCASVVVAGWAESPAEAPHAVLPVARIRVTSATARMCLAGPQSNGDVFFMDDKVAKNSCHMAR